MRAVRRDTARDIRYLLETQQGEVIAIPTPPKRERSASWTTCVRFRERISPARRDDQS